MGLVSGFDGPVDGFFAMSCQQGFTEE
jgi:hypothetical protein